MTHFVRVPLVNVNDDVMTLVEWLKAPGAPVRRGESLALLESTKATSELEAEDSGYFAPLVDAGLEVRVGQVIAALTARPDEPVSIPVEAPAAAPTTSARRWTKKAEILAKRYGADLEALAAQKGDTLTEQDIEDFRAGRFGRKPAPAARDLVDDVYPTNKVQRLLILGAGRGAVQILDALTRIPGQRCVGLLDDDTSVHGKTVMGCPVLGAMGEGARLWQEHFFDAVIISISTSIKARVKLFQQYTSAGIPFANVIDPSALVMTSASLGTGNVILALCHIGTCAAIGDNNFLSARTHIEHHNIMGDHCTFGPGVFTSSRVKIGQRVKFGTGIFIEPGITVGDDSIVASGAVLTRHIPARTIVKMKTAVQLRERTDL